VEVTSNLNLTKAAAVPHSSLSFTSNQPPAVIYKCITIGGLPGVRGGTDGTNGASRFDKPWGIAVDKEGCVYVADWGDSTIRKLTLDQTNWVVNTIIGTPGKHGSADGTNAEARLSHPHGIAIDDEGNLYVADTFNHTIRKIRRFGSNWVATTIAGQVGVSGVLDGTNSGARFNGPGSVTIGPDGDLFVADTQNNAIRKLTLAGSNWVVTTIAGLAGPVEGSSDGTNREARFFAPFGVAADSHDNLYVADFENSTVRKITRNGADWVVTTIAGLAGNSGYADGTNNAARLSHPQAIAVDQADNVYVLDSGTDTIRLIQCIGTNYVVRTIVGLPWRWGYADGTNNTVQFNVAEGIAVDKAGNIFVADTGNNVVRQIIPPFPAEDHANLVILEAIGLFVLVAGFVALSIILHRRRNPA
jgi:sugar lactone lactonase YvrE